MGDILMLSGLILSCVLMYQWSYNKLWFLVDYLFEAIMAPSASKDMENIPKLESDDNPFLYKLYADYSVSSAKILKSMRIIFSMAMMSYLVTIEIVLWQIKNSDGDVGQRATFISTWVWPVITLILSILLILVQPFFALMMLLNKFFDDKMDIDTLVIITSGTLVILITALNFTTIGPFKYTENVLTKLSIVGITIMAILSAIATVSTLYYTYIMMKKGIQYSGNADHSRKFFDGSNTGTLLWYTDDMARRKMETYQIRMEESVQVLVKLDKETGGEKSSSRTHLMDEIGWYQLELGQLESRLRESKIIRNGKRIFQFSFLLYCLQKIVITFTKRIPTIISNTITGYPDDQLDKDILGDDPLAITVANILDIVLFRFKDQHDLDALIRQISLIISTSLFICSFSTVATTVSYMVTLLPTRFRLLAMYAIHSGEKSSELPNFKKDTKEFHYYKPPSIIKNFFVSELSGVYVAGTILTIRSNLPFDVAQKVNELLGERFTVPSAVIDSWFDIVYALFCILTIFGIKTVEGTFLK